MPLERERGPLRVRLREDGALELRLHAPERANALSPAMLEALGEALREARERDEVRAVVLRGAGRHFCAGADLEAFLRDGGEAPLLRFAELLEALWWSELPLVALVQGAARGGALGLLGCCHVVFATPRASFALPEARLGLYPMMLAPVLQRRLGRPAFARLAVFQERWDAETARREGLVTQLVPEAELEAALDRWLRPLRDTDPGAVRAGLRTGHAAEEEPLGEGLREGARQLAALLRRPETRARLQAARRNRSGS